MKSLVSSQKKINLVDLSIEGVQNRYNIDSFENNKWLDSVGDKDVKQTGHMLELVKKENYIKYEDGIDEGFPYLKGKYNTKIEFPMNLKENNWTIVYVTRYEPNGKYTGRILQGNTNWLAGHHANKAGVSYQKGWLTGSGFKHNKSWVFAIEQPKKFIRRTGNKEWETFTGGNNIGNDIIYINAGGYSHEYSDFNIAELIIYKRKLNDKEIEVVKKYIEDRYIN